ncbi:COG4123: Predicted O-methyltransferase [hydrothermal vent metagenome]|uniref:COG4123: Predicted O-methyltransferase n=1 Tax=hydrothermal vent metagenome TaxID=652676 RepID=A0A3B1DDQ9_9ZZZZ
MSTFTLVAEGFVVDNLTLDSICGVRLYQSVEGYRFSIDSVLLAGFAGCSKGVGRVVDLGAGSGVVGLILARRYPWTDVLLIEVQEGLSALAQRNIELNQLRQRVQVLKADVSSLLHDNHPDLIEGFDAVVSNPPFRKPGTGRISPYGERAIARHEIMLTLTDLIKTSSALLKNRGRFLMVYHPYRLNEVIYTMKESLLEPKRIRFVHPDDNSEATMVLIEAVKGGGVELKVEKPLFIYERDGLYTEEMAALYSG